MSFEIRIARRVAESIRKLKPRVRAEVLDGIERAGNDTQNHSRVSSGPYAGRPCYSFRITMPPRVIQIACVFLYEQDEAAIYVTALGILGNDSIAMPEGTSSD